jgi:hypothetical protein
MGERAHGNKYRARSSSLLSDRLTGCSCACLQVSLIALVIQQEVKEFGVVYKLEDGSGSIEGTMYRDRSQAASDEEPAMQDHTNKYVQVRLPFEHTQGRAAAIAEHAAD